MIKRLFDVVASAVALMLLWPILVVAAIAIRVTMGSPVFFRQLRPGLHGDPFMLVKFRTMIEGDAVDSDRLTRLGRFLRSTSVDELPEFFNILRGEMSLVGPRPLLLEYLPLYSDRQAMRHAVRPGLTGLAQVNGRNASSWEERFELDVEYVERQTLLLDLKIVFRTIRAVVLRDGIAAEGEATMAHFLGNSEVS